jgi:hypothetical protein
MDYIIYLLIKTKPYINNIIINIKLMFILINIYYNVMILLYCYILYII